MSVTKDHFDRRMDELQSLISKLQNENKVLRAENKLLRTELVHVKTTALRSEMYARRNNILIHGVEAPQGTENLRETVVTFFQSKLGITDADQLSMGTLYRISKKTAPSQSGTGPSLRSNSQKQKAIEPIFISLSDTERSAIMKECGKLKKTGFSVSTDLPAELGKRRKELLALGYKLKSSKSAAEKVAETRVVQRGIRLWLEVKKSRNLQWTKSQDDCFDPLKLAVPAEPDDTDFDA